MKTFFSYLMILVIIGGIIFSVVKVCKNDSKNIVDNEQNAVQTVINNSYYKVSTLKINNKATEKIVYITNTGKCYHRSSCKYLRHSKTAVEYSVIKNCGYRACSVCNP